MAKMRVPHAGCRPTVKAECLRYGTLQLESAQKRVCFRDCGYLSALNQQEEDVFQAEVGRLEEVSGRA
jgi:hypothetical protein